MGRIETMSKEPQGELISMQLPQMSIVSIELAIGSVGFSTCLTAGMFGSQNHGTGNSEGLESKNQGLIFQ